MSRIYSFARNITFLGALLITFAAQSQTVYENSQDGKLWIRLTAQYANPAVVSDINNMQFEELPFIQAFVSKYGITKLSKPFAVLKDSKVLQRTYQVDFDKKTMVDELIRELQQTGNLDFAERVPLDKLCYTPNDYTFTGDWHLAKINATGAWNYSKGSTNIIIAVTDNAIQRTHPDLTNDVYVNSAEQGGVANVDDDGNGYIDDIYGYDVADNDNNVLPASTAWNHGTHTSGLATASTNNGTGVASIGFNTRLLPVKVTMNSAGSNSVTHGYQGISYAIVSGADVISCSWGGGSYSSTGQSVIDNAYNKGIIVCGAAGNNSNVDPEYPGAYDHVICVANTTTSDSKSSSSSYGKWVDVSAPGTSVGSTVPNNTYANLTGTSMSTPIVAGLCGLMLSLNSALTPDDVESCLKSTCDPVSGSYAPFMGAGRINASKAMACVAATVGAKPTTDFTVNQSSSCDGKFQFFDNSFNSVTAYSWDFGDGTPADTNRNPYHTYTNAGSYNVKLTATNANGSTPLTKNSFVTVAFSATPNVINDTVCKPGKATLQASGSGTINWFGSQSSFSPFMEGPSYTTPTLSSNKTYYVSDRVSRTSTTSAGKSSTSGSGGYYTSPAWLYFDVLKDIELQEVTVDANGAGNRVIELKDHTGTIWYSKTANLSSGSQQVKLNWVIPQGQMYQIGIYSGTTSLFRNNGSVSFPYTDAGNRVVVHQSSQPSLIYYYFFYDWKVSDPPCESKRVPVTGYVKDCTGMEEYSNNVNINAYPNPAQDAFNIEMSLAKEDQVEIGLYNMEGKLVKSLEEGFYPTGTYRFHYTTTGIPEGLYMIRIVTSTGSAVKRLSLIK